MVNRHKNSDASLYMTAQESLSKHPYHDILKDAFQSPESRVHSPESIVQSPEFRVQGPVQSPVQLLDYAGKFGESLDCKYYHMIILLQLPCSGILMALSGVLGT